MVKTWSNVFLSTIVTKLLGVLPHSTLMSPCYNNVFIVHYIHMQWLLSCKIRSVPLDVIITSSPFPYTIKPNIVHAFMHIHYKTKYSSSCLSPSLWLFILKKNLQWPWPSPHHHNNYDHDLTHIFSFLTLSQRFPILTNFSSSIIFTYCHHVVRRHDLTLNYLYKYLT